MQLLPLPTETIPKNRSQGLIRAYGIIHYLGMVELKYTLADEILGACHLDSILNWTTGRFCLFWNLNFWAAAIFSVSG